MSVAVRPAMVDDLAALVEMAHALTFEHFEALAREADQSDA